MNNNLIRKVFLFVITIITLNSCVLDKNILYFQESSQEKNKESSNNYNPIFKVDDLLSITVSSLDLEAAIPFNLPSTGVTPGNAGYTSGAPSTMGYLVDKDGNIDFPILGKIKIAGLNRETVNTELKEKLKDYLKEPIVNIKIQNFKITVLGEVARPGTFYIPNERVTIFEAIGIAGDLNITGIRNNVLVIREIGNEKVKYRVDLTSDKILKSPVYYLNQNDLVYISPNRTKINSSAVNPSNASLILSSVSLIITTLFLITK